MYIYKRDAIERAAARTVQYQNGDQGQRFVAEKDGMQGSESAPAIAGKPVQRPLLREKQYSALVRKSRRTARKRDRRSLCDRKRPQIAGQFFVKFVASAVSN